MASTDLIHTPVAIPASLAAAGVRVVESGGIRQVEIPAGLTATYNVLQPISELTQSDPDWTPRLVIVNLNKDQHTYLQEGKLALRREGILLLANAAGIDVSVHPMPREVLDETEIGYQAYATLRRSDGTLARWEGSRAVDRAVEREKVKAQCIKNGAFDEAYFAKRWAVERDHMRAKCESKAILRAVSAAMQLKRGGYTPEEIAKPFLLVAYSSTPSDPEVRRERSLAASGAVYGRRALEPAQDVDAVELPALPAPDPDDVVDHVPAAAQPAQAPAPEQEEPPITQEPVPGEMPPDVAAAADFVIPFGKRKDQKLGSIEPHALKWFAEEYTLSVGADAPRRALKDAAVILWAWHQEQAA